jgi:RNA polymerase sigma factor (sigma-70 family)
VAKDSFVHIEDKELLEKFYNDKNTQWLGILLQRYTMLLLGVCMKYLKNEEEAKDSVQQIFLKAIVELQKYKVDYFKSWLYMIAKNYCLMKIRNNQGKISVELNNNMLVEQEGVYNKYEQIEKDKTLSLIEESLNELNSEQKQCVTLFYLQKKTYQQISELTGFTLLQVKSFIQNGKRNLKQIVEKKMKILNG